MAIPDEVAAVLDIADRLNEALDRTFNPFIIIRPYGCRGGAEPGPTTPTRTTSLIAWAGAGGQGNVQCMHIRNYLERALLNERMIPIRRSCWENLRGAWAERKPTPVRVHRALGNDDELSRFERILFDDTLAPPAEGYPDPALSVEQYGRILALVDRDPRTARLAAIGRRVMEGGEPDYAAPVGPWRPLVRSMTLDRHRFTPRRAWELLFVPGNIDVSADAVEMIRFPNSDNGDLAWGMLVSALKRGPLLEPRLTLPLSGQPGERPQPSKNVLTQRPDLSQRPDGKPKEGGIQPRQRRRRHADPSNVSRQGAEEEAVSVVPLDGRGSKFCGSVSEPRPRCGGHAHPAGTSSVPTSVSTSGRSRVRSQRMHVGSPRSSSQRP